MGLRAGSSGHAAHVGVWAPGHFEGKGGPRDRSLAGVTDGGASMPRMKITTSPTPPANGNSGIVPPWLQKPQPITILPMPDGWEAPVLRGTFEVVAPVAR